MTFSAESLSFNNNILASAQCPPSWYSTAAYGMPGCFAMMQNKNDTVPWGYAQDACQKMDPRARLPIFASAAQVSLFKMMSR